MVIISAIEKETEHGLLKTAIDDNTGDVLVQMGGHVYPIDSEFSGGHYTDHYTDHYPQTSGQDYGGDVQGNVCVRSGFSNCTIGS